MNILLPEIVLITKDARAAVIQNRKNFSWYNIICTWFWVGQLGFIPGTFGSLAVYPLYYFSLNFVLKAALSSSNADINWIQTVQIILYVFTIVLFLVGSVALSKFHEETQAMDHKSVVIDEVVGMLLTLAISCKWLLHSAKFFKSILGINELYSSFLLAFVIFRIFDIWKPLIIGIVDSRYKNTLGVMLDDILAALFSAFTIWVISSCLVK